MTPTLLLSLLVFPISIGIGFLLIYPNPRYLLRNKKKHCTFVSIGGMDWEIMNYGSNLLNPFGKTYTQQAGIDACDDDMRRVPTSEEWTQLFDRTHHKFIKSKWWRLWQQAGILLTDKENGNTLFLFTNYGSNCYGFYWSSTVYDAYCGYYCSFIYSSYHIYYHPTILDYYIRCVRKTA